LNIILKTTIGKYINICRIISNNMPHSTFSTKPKKVPEINTEYRTIKTDLPAPGTEDIISDLEKYESNSMHGQLPVVWDKAENFNVWDIAGNKFIDFTSTIFVANAGHGNKRIRDAIKKILDKPLLHTYNYAYKERRDYLKYLIKNTPKQFEKAFLLSAGTEAVEAALKLMRVVGKKRGKKGPVIIAFENNWHGRTMGAQMLCSNEKQKEWIGYLDPNIHHLPFPYPWVEKDPEKFFTENMEKLAKEKGINPDQDICGFILETFQGWGAVFYPPEFVKAIETFAKKRNILITFDEMQAGFGRTGKLFGYMHYGVGPDILCCGKGASSSVPLSFVLGNKEIMDSTEIGAMSSTHSANPISCAAGLANMQAILEDGLLENSETLGKIFHKRLNKIKEKFPNTIKYINGKGLLAAVLFIDKDGNPLSALCTDICRKALDKGLIMVHTGRESIKLAPPLSINEEAMLEGLEVFEEAITESLKQHND